MLGLLVIRLQTIRACSSLMAFEPVRRKANGNRAWTKQASDAVNMRQPKEAAIPMCSKYVSPTDAGCSVNDRRATGLSHRLTTASSQFSCAKSLRFLLPFVRFGVFHTPSDRDPEITFHLDAIDRKILACLQEDATISIADLAVRAGVSSSPCWRRVQRLEREGVIRGRVALLDAEKMRVGVTVFVSVRTSHHSTEWSERFCRAVSPISEVVELHRMSGSVDYLLRVVVPDIAAYDAVYKQLIAICELADVSSSFSMERIKYTTALPTRYAP
jgi:Lrp/AsnC family transcriptional regulator